MYTFIQHTNEDKDGFSFSIMEQEGNAFGYAYIYKVNNSVIFLDMLSVSPEYRRQGIGTKLQELREQIGREYGAEFSKLFVNKDSWLCEWYKRRGYDFNGFRHHRPDHVWMIKNLYPSRRPIIEEPEESEEAYAKVVILPNGQEHLIRELPLSGHFGASGDFILEHGSISRVLGVDYLYPGVLFNIDEEQYDKLRLFVKIR